MRRLCIVILLLLLFAPATFASGKLGVNIAGKYGDLERALTFAGENGWITIASQPNDQLASFIQRASENKVHVVIRGHYPGIVLDTVYAQRWVNFFASHNFPNRVYFIPVNEPNNDQENVSSLEAIKTYTQYLFDQLTAHNLRKTSVYMLAPALDIYQLADTQNAQYTALGGARFFSQFDGIPLHVYVEFTKDGMVNESAHRYKKGDWKAILNDLQLGTMPVFIEETGILCTDCVVPDDGGKDKVKYPYNTTYQVMYSSFLSYVSNNQDWGNGQVQMFSILSYDPIDFSRASWLNDQPAVLLLNTQGGSIGTSPDVAYARAHTINTIFSIANSSAPVRSNVVTSIFSSATDTFLKNVGQYKPNLLQNPEENVGFDYKKAAENADFARKKSVSVTAESPEQRETFFTKLQSALGSPANALGFIFSSATEEKSGYAFSLSPQQSHSTLTGRGADSVNLGEENDRVHSDLLSWYTPYRMNHTLVYKPSSSLVQQQPDLTTYGTAVPATGATSDVIPSQTSSDAARKIFLITGYACGWARLEGHTWTEQLSVPITNSNYNCLQKKLQDENGKPYSMSQGAFGLMKASTLAYKDLQCVGFAMATQREKNVLPATSADSAQGLSGNTWIESQYINPDLALEGRNAKNYCSGSVARGYVRFEPDTADATGGIRVGDLVIWTYEPWGHIAVVGKTNQRNRTVSVYEANWGGKGVVHTREAGVQSVDCYLRSR